MEENAAIRTIRSSIQALGSGFDVNCDTRLLYCKGTKSSRIVEVDEEHVRDQIAFDDVLLPEVSRDVRFSQEIGGRQSTVVCSYLEMAGIFNKRAQLSGNTPLGGFNFAFSFTGSKKIDMASTKSLAMDGMFMPLCKVMLTKQPSSLGEDVKKAVPSSWEPSLLARFIESYGTHIITSVTIGGKDEIYVKQQSSSHLSFMDIKNYIQDIGDQRFSENEGHSSSGPMKMKDKATDPFSFNGQGVYPQPPTAPYLSAKEDVTIIFRRRGGDDLIQSHSQWKNTVRHAPDIIEMTFMPIAFLLDGIPGKDHLIRAIALYLEYKPPIEELQYFLEFQVARVWAPIRENLPGHHRKEPVCPYLQFSVMGQKLYISLEQVSVVRRPVTGLRLCLEGMKQNRLTIHLQHLASLPKVLQQYWDSHIPIGAPKWQGPEEQDSRWFEPVRWKNFSHVSTAPIEHNDAFIDDLSGAFVVTGAQLGVWDFGSKNVLYLKLLYSKLPGCTIRRSFWDHNPVLSGENLKYEAVKESANSTDSQSSSSKVVGKLQKLIEMSEISKGPDDVPGHWLITGGKFGVEKGKIVLRVKYSLLAY
ncbi:MACPF domain-containing protein CAD1 [Dendrobium catenatum]|uniref:MACPF domain-containing protein CAD1 n=1 Tax=Dendrobium catenatum TaxID=906689 RepID=UPI0009F23E83|nr:MACPF domain-containing protein CAD1 [Dendrobium catenatum]